MPLPLILGAVGAASGLISGASDKKTSQSVEVNNAGEFETRMRAAQQTLFSELERAMAKGPGEQDVAAATGAQRDLAAQLQDLSRTGGLPTEADLGTGTKFADIAFASQREKLSQDFEDQQVAASRNAAFLGREENDPILRAKLAQEQTRQSRVLSGEQGALAQNVSFALPGQRLAFAGQRADILSGLANQAFQNRQGLLQVGNTLAEQERAYRLNTATRTQTEHGSFGQALAGGLAGGAMGFNVGTKLGMKPELNAPNTQVPQAPQVSGVPQQQQPLPVITQPAPTTANNYPAFMAAPAPLNFGESMVNNIVTRAPSSVPFYLAAPGAPAAPQPVRNTENVGRAGAFSSLGNAATQGFNWLSRTFSR
jgi:hypothetical protein